MAGAIKCGLPSLSSSLSSSHDPGVTSAASSSSSSAVVPWRPFYAKSPFPTLARSERHFFSLPRRGRRLAHSRRVIAAGIQIDRRRYFDDLLTRQLEAEAREAEATLTCPVECIREVYNCSEFDKVLREAEEANSLVVVDFYSSSCGACKYLLPQLVKLCKSGCGDECPVEDPTGVIFVKHNVRDEYDEPTINEFISNFFLFCRLVRNHEGSLWKAYKPPPKMSWILRDFIQSELCQCSRCS